jgi:cysteine synthase A
MIPKVANNIVDLIGSTPLIRLRSLSQLSQCDIFVKCENYNPGGSVKDRAALNMIREAEDSGVLRPGMTIVEGSAGNTGIGLSLVAKALGYRMLVVMPKGQDPAKERTLRLWGADIEMVDPCPFTNEDHFYHRARRISEQKANCWWANQFENLANYKAHLEGTGPEIFRQMDERVDHFVAAAGTGGTIAGCSQSLKSFLPNVKITLLDPRGSGLKSYVDTGTWKASEGSSITEGIGIMRLVGNFSKAKIDEAVTIEDQDLVTVAYHLRDQEGIIPGLSAALNIAGAFREACRGTTGRRIVTILCDGGERATEKLYNLEFLSAKGLSPDNQNIEGLKKKYKAGH